MTEPTPRIAFVNASVGYSDRRKSKPIGLAYIMAFLRENGFDSTGFDFGDAEDDAVELAAQYGLADYDIVGFSVYNESFQNAAAMARWIKQRRPDGLIVVGGPHATAVHEHIASKYPCFDLIVRREGEEPMLDIVRARTRGHGYDGISGVTVCQPNQPPLVNPERDLKRDLDELPFPDAEFVSHSGYPPVTYFDSVAGRLKPALTMCSSRSCPYNCSFCGVLTIGRRYRARRHERVVEELLYFRNKDGVDYGHIYFSDANFFVSPRRALQIARALHDADPDVTFSFGTRVNQVLRAAHALPELKACGMRFIELGVESASEAVLERLSKGVGADVNVAVMRLLTRLQIEVSLDFIMLDPATTLDDIDDNLKFLRTTGLFDYAPHDHLYSALVLYEGTPIRKYYADRYGLKFDPAELPPVFGMFEVSEVQRLSDELRVFRRRYQVEIDEVLALLEFACAQAPAERLAQMQLDAIALRHAPNLFMERLLADARAGFPITDADGIDALLPLLSHDCIALRPLLTRARTAANDVGIGDAPALAWRETASLRDYSSNRVAAPRTADVPQKESTPA